MPTKKNTRRTKDSAPSARRTRAASTGGARRRSGGARGAGKGRRTSPASLSALSTEALAAELHRRRSEIPRLEAEAVRLRAALGAIEERIAFLERVGGGAAPARARAAKSPTSPRSGPNRGASTKPRKPRKGEPTLGERIVGLLEDRRSVLSPREIAEAMGAQLGREVNQSLLVHVSLTLRKLVNQGRIRQPGRGQYGAAAPNGGSEGTPSDAG